MRQGKLTPEFAHYDHRVQTQETGRLGQRNPFSVLNYGDWTLLALLSAFLCLMCIWRSHGRLLWADELLGDRLLNRTSFTGMLRGWWEGADGGGIFYYLLGRGWVNLAGSSELALRLFSTLGMATAILLAWTLARRYFSMISVAWSVALISLYSQSLRWQEINGRFYGLFLSAAVLASLAFILCSEELVTWRAVLLISFANALLVGSHTLGFVYSAGLFAAMLVRDALARRLFPRVYLGILASWTVFLLAAHSIFRSTTITKHLFWTTKPHLHELLIGIAAYDPILLRFLVAVLGLTLLKLFFNGRLGSVTRGLRHRAPVWLCLGLLLAQLLLFFKSHFGLSIYADRYLLPLALLFLLIFSACLDELLFRRRGLSIQRSVGVSLLVLAPAAAYAFGQHDLASLYPKSGLPSRLTAQLSPGIPVLITLLPDYLLMERYDNKRHFYFLLDWPYDLVPSREKVNDYSGQREMENWHRAELIPNSILECPEVFRQNHQIYLFLDPGRQQWLQDRILSNPGYTAQRLGEQPEWNPYTLWLVRRGPGVGPPC